MLLPSAILLPGLHALCTAPAEHKSWRSTTHEASSRFFHPTTRRQSLLLYMNRSRPRHEFPSKYDDPSAQKRQNGGDSNSNNHNVREARYSEAAFARRSFGHKKAQPLFQAILHDYGEGKDSSTATRLAAMDNLTGLRNVFTSNPQQLRGYLEAANYTNAAVQSIFGIHNSQHPLFHASCPIYLKTIPPGSSPENRPRVCTPTECLAALFLLGWSLPQTVVQSTLGKQFLQIPLNLNLLERCNTDNSLFALIALFPVAVTSTGRIGRDLPAQSWTTLWVAADWNPRVLGTTRLFDCDMGNRQTEEPVMYIGPDSLALVQLAIPSMFSSCSTTNDSFMDVCTGSGIQSLVAAHYIVQSRGTDTSNTFLTDVLAMDLNPRALDCTYWNFRLNGFCQNQHLRLQLIQGNVCQPSSSFRLKSIVGDGDVVVQQARTMWKDFANLESLVDFLGDKSGVFPLKALTANPPFVPAPPRLATSERQTSYGLFSVYRPNADALECTDDISFQENVGSTGEEVWRGILEHIVKPYLCLEGRAAIVSEFFWGDHPLERLKDMHQLLSQNINTGMLLLTNEHPLNVSIYAQRRTLGGNETEINEWLMFLKKQGYRSMSPGLLFLDRSKIQFAKNESIAHAAVQKSKYGSLWTPSNPVAARNVKQILNDLMNW